MSKVNFIEINLKYPIKVKDKEGVDREMDVLRLGRFKAKHFLLLPSGVGDENSKISPAEMIPIIAGLAGLSNDEAGEIDMTDISEIADRLPEIMGELISLEAGES